MNLDKKYDDEIQRILEKEPEVIDLEKKIKVIFISICFALLSMIAFFITAKQVRAPDVIFVNESLISTGLRGLHYPIQSKYVIRKWTGNAVRKMYTFNFLQYTNQLQEIKPFFTEDGWESFKVAFNNSDLKRKMTENFMDVSVTLKEEPYLLGGLNGVAFDKKTGEEFAWKVVVPVTIAFTANGGKSVFENKLLEITVIRVPTTENPFGLGIVRVQPKDMKAGI